MMMSTSKTDILKALVNERLMVAAEEIFGLFERALVDYEEERLEIERQHNNKQLLLAAGWRAPPLLPVSDEDGVSEQQLYCMQERTSCVDQEDPGPPPIKEEQEERWTSQAGLGEQHQESGNVDAHDSMFNIIYAQHLKSDLDEDGRQSHSLPLCQSEENAECDHAPSTSTDQIKTEPEEEGRRETEPISDCSSFSSHRSVVESGDSGSDEDWSNINKTKKPQQLGDLGERPYSCSVCNKSFGHKHVLSRHMKTHNGEKPYSCNICGKRFIQRAYLQTHINSHSGQKPYTCSLCGRGFTQVGNLNAHMKIHTGEKPHSCTDCGKGFRLKSDLLKHTIIHTGEKPYGCSVCRVKFSAQSNLSRHMKTHSGERPYSCSVCDKHFTRRSHLNIHMKNHPGEKFSVA